jgi:condensin complex subunit 1
LSSLREQVLNQIIEQELVMRNLLGKFLPLLSYLVANEQQQYSHPLLRETAVLALCRYMCTSSAVCESLLPLLFTVLERESAVSVRTTVMIALGDLAFRFPNSIEPWTHRMYSR